MSSEKDIIKLSFETWIKDNFFLYDFESPPEQIVKSPIFSKYIEKNQILIFRNNQTSSVHSISVNHKKDRQIQETSQKVKQKSFRENQQEFIENSQQYTIKPLGTQSVWRVMQKEEKQWHLKKKDQFKIGKMEFKVLKIKSNYSEQHYECECFKSKKNKSFPLSLLENDSYKKKKKNYKDLRRFTVIDSQFKGEKISINQKPNLQENDMISYQNQQITDNHQNIDGKSNIKNNMNSQISQYSTFGVNQIMKIQQNQNSENQEEKQLLIQEQSHQQKQKEGEQYYAQQFLNELQEEEKSNQSNSELQLSNLEEYNTDVSRIMEQSQIKQLKFVPDFQSEQILSQIQEGTQQTIQNKIQNNIQTPYAEEWEPACKICLSRSSDYENPLVNPCMCKGSAEFVHIFCLSHWIKSRLKIQIYEDMLEINQKALKCEICKHYFPEQIVREQDGAYEPNVQQLQYQQEEQKIYQLYDLQLNSHPNKKFQQYVYLEDQEWNLYILDLKEQIPFRIGRGADCNFKIPEITVSRNHIELQMIEGNLYINNLSPKFGTLLKQSKFYEFDSPVTFQCGRSLVNISLEKEKSFFSNFLCLCTPSDKLVKERKKNQAFIQRKHKPSCKYSESYNLKN